jgi:hypothetical protein
MMLKILFSLALSLLLSFSVYAGDKCVNCSSDSSCKQCKLDGNQDNQKNRKKCESMGCKITGTGSCSTAANVKVCNK